MDNCHMLKAIKRGESHIAQIPKHISMWIAHCRLTDIIAYYESEEGQKGFEEWRMNNLINKTQNETKISRKA